jgi:hypothetical protein
MQTFPDKRTEQEIGSLRIKCGNVDKGCQEQLELRDAQNHKEICPLELIPCSFADVGCRKTILRREMEEHNKKEIVDHLDLCRKKIAKLNSKEASMSEGVVPGAPEDIAVLNRKPNGFRIKIEHFDRMFPNSFKWISPVFKVDEWYFTLHSNWSAYGSNYPTLRNITFSLRIVEGPLCSAVGGNGVHLLGEVAVLDADFKNHLMSPQVFQVEMLMNPAGNNWDAANPVSLRTWAVTNTQAQANPTVICHLNFWQVSCHHKLS